MNYKGLRKMWAWGMCFFLIGLMGCKEKNVSVNIVYHEKEGTMQVISKDFANDQMMPEYLTCDGKNLSPRIQFFGVPQNAKSLALSCVDPDAPGGSFIHWIVYNIPPVTTEIPQGGTIPQGASQATNDFGIEKYGGPCPPSGTHHYIFTLYALSCEKLDNVNRSNFHSLFNQHKIEEARIVGLYKRKR